MSAASLCAAACASASAAGPVVPLLRMLSRSLPPIPDRIECRARRDAPRCRQEHADLLRQRRHDCRFGREAARRGAAERVVGAADQRRLEYAETQVVREVLRPDRAVGELTVGIRAGGLDAAGGHKHVADIGQAVAEHVEGRIGMRRDCRNGKAEAGDRTNRETT